jgi:hypothetical protein
LLFTITILSLPVTNRFIIFILFPDRIFKKKLILGYLFKTNQTTIMNQPVNPQSRGVSINLHQQRIFTLVFAVIAFIGMILPWSSANLGFMAKQTSNGFAGWGILTLFGVAGAIVAALFGDKTKELDQTFRYIGIGSFIAIILGAFIAFMQIVNGGGFGVKSGIGVWFCIIAGVLGLLWVTGVIKMPPKGPMPPSSMPSTPPAPPPPPPSTH